jgi:hypothetical protein
MQTPPRYLPVHAYLPAPPFSLLEVSVGGPAKTVGGGHVFLAAAYLLPVLLHYLYASVPSSVAGVVLYYYSCWWHFGAGLLLLHTLPAPAPPPSFCPFTCLPCLPLPGRNWRWMMSPLLLRWEAEEGGTGVEEGR